MQGHLLESSRSLNVSIKSHALSIILNTIVITFVSYISVHSVIDMFVTILSWKNKFIYIYKEKDERRKRRSEFTRTGYLSRNIYNSESEPCVRVISLSVLSEEKLQCSRGHPAWKIVFAVSCLRAYLSSPGDARSAFSWIFSVFLLFFRFFSDLWCSLTLG